MKSHPADRGKIQVGRIAFREEGTLWNAYYAMPDTMKDAIYLGGIHMGAARIPEIKQAFKAVMQAAVGIIIETSVGGEPEWAPTQPAPAHEKGGKA